MTASAVQSTTTVQPQRAQQPSTNAKNYLNRTAEMLKPEAINSFSKKHTAWKVAAIVTTVALSVLAVAILAASIALTATGVFSPVAIPIGILVSIGLGTLAAFIGTKFWRNSENNKAQLEVCKELPRYYEPLKNLTPDQIRDNLIEKGLLERQIPDNPEDLRALTPLIARQDMLQARIERLETEREAQTAATRGTSNRSSHPVLDLELEDEILRAKVEAAFVNAMLRMPNFSGEPKDLFYILKDSLIKKHSNYLHFKVGQIHPTRMEEMQNLTIAEHGQRIFAAMVAYNYSK